MIKYLEFSNFRQEKKIQMYNIVTEETNVTIDIKRI